MGLDDTAHDNVCCYHRSTFTTYYYNSHTLPLRPVDSSGLPLSSSAGLMTTTVHRLITCVLDNLTGQVVYYAVFAVLPNGFSSH